jgi:hypothetical protein
LVCVAVLLLQGERQDPSQGLHCCPHLIWTLCGASEPSPRSVWRWCWAEENKENVCIATTDYFRRLSTLVWHAALVRFTSLLSPSLSLLPSLTHCFCRFRHQGPEEGTTRVWVCCTAGAPGCSASGGYVCVYQGSTTLQCALSFCSPGGICTEVQRGNLGC